MMQWKRNKAPAGPAVHDVASASEIWRVLLQSGNIQPKEYDEDIVLQLCRSLKLAADCSSFTAGGADFAQALDDREISREKFVRALFSAAQPFAEMMTQLCSFFERYSVRGTDRALRMQFDFDEPGKELIFDLKHFREWLKQWEKVEGIVEAECWDTSSLWKLVSAILPKNNRDARVDDAGAREWIDANDYRVPPDAAIRWAPPPRPREVGRAEIDGAARRVYRTISAVARACSRFGSYARLVDAANELDRRSGRPAALVGESGHPAPVVEWDIRSLRQLESDFFLSALMRALWEWLEGLERLPSNSRLPAAQPVLSRLQTLFSSIPTKRVPGEIDLESLLSFLRLPLWKERPALYAAWMITVVEQALHDYPVQIHDEDGTLRFSFKAARMATFLSSAGEIALVAEDRAPLDQPVGESRTGHVQPDYVLLVGDIHDPDNAKLVLELKQYLRPSPKKFSAALIDYARAFAKGQVLLADYGPISPAVMGSVPADLATRTGALGDVRPGKTREIQDLQQRIRRALPLPVAQSSDQPPLAVSTILIDVSGSMREVLTWQGVLQQLRDLAGANPQATWVAVDTQVRVAPAGPQALDWILALEMIGSTDLARLVAPYENPDTIVVTDSDGETQLRAQAPRLRRIGLATREGIEWVSPAG